MQFSKEEYQKKQKELLKQKSLFSTVKENVFSGMKNLGSINVKGEGIINSEDIEDGYCVCNAKQAKNVIFFEGGDTGSANVYDGINIGADIHHCYAICQF
jgi:hypothetical protein